MKSLVFTPDGTLVWKITTVPYGSEGAYPEHNEECPYFLAYGTATSCVSGSGDSLCGGCMGGTAGFVYCS
jgi:hypothetical protein